MESRIFTVILSDNSTRNVLSAYIKEQADFLLSEELNSFDEIATRLANSVFPFLIVDLNNDCDNKLNFILQICKDVPNCKVVVMSDEPSVDLIVKSMRAGAKEFLPLPVIKTELFDVLTKIKRSFDEPQVTKSKCKIISVFSNKGGIGKTSVATNLAVELAQITKERTALIDLNFQAGDITTFMDLKPAFNISYLLNNLDKINEDFLFSTFEKYKDLSLYVLADPPFFKQTVNISPKQILKLFNILKDTFSYIVVDAGAGFDSDNITVLSEADMLVLVTVANLPALRNSQRCLELFDKLGIDNTKINILLNRYMENDEVGLADVEKVLNKKIYWKIPNNYFTMMSAINKGVPVSIMNPDSNVAKSYKDLAMFITNNIFRNKLAKKYDNILQ